MGSDRADGSAVFEALRPLCVTVMSHPSVESLTSLQTGVISLPKTTSIPSEMVSYLTLPIRAAIRRSGSSNERLLETSLLALAEILSRVKHLEIWEIFNDFFSFLSMLLDEKMSAETGFSFHSEDLLMAALKVLKKLMLCISPSIHKKLFADLVPLGHCISTLLDMASRSNSNPLCKEALYGLCALTGLDVGPILHATRILQTTHPQSPHLPGTISMYLDLMKDKVGVDVRGEEGWALASFLPGVSTAMCRLVSSDSKTVEPVVTLALIVWAHYVGVVMEGEGIVASKKKVLVEDEKNDVEEKTPMSRHSTSLLVERTREWSEETGNRLSVLIQRVSVLVTSDAWKLRLHVVGWAHSLLSHSHSCLEMCVPPLVEILVTLVHDPYPQVSLAAHTSLQQFPGGGHTLSSLLGKQLHSLATSLPRLIRHHDETRKVATLQLLAGYLRLAGGHVGLMIHSLPHLSRLVQSLIQALTLEQTHSLHVMDMSLPTLDPSYLFIKPLPLPYANFCTDQVAILLGEVCRLLGCRGDLPVLLDYVLDQLQRSPYLRNEYLLLLSHLLTGAAHKGCGHEHAPPTAVNPDEMFVLVDGMLRTLLTSDVWTRPRDPSSDHASPNSSLCAFLLIFVLFTSVHVLGATFDPLLQQLIYPLMQWLGDDNVSISNAAMATLLAISSHCDYESLADLIQVNTDYLVHSISVHLRNTSHSTTQPEAVQVLRAVVSHGKEEVCLLVRDSIEDLLLCLDTKQLDPHLVWVGLRTVSENCERWIDERKLKEERVEPLSKGRDKSVEVEDEVTGPAEPSVGIEAIAKFFRDYHKDKESKLAEEEEGKEEVEDDTDGEERYSSKLKLPAAEEVCVEILHRCVHHMAHHNSTVRMVVMDTIQHCFKGLRHDKITLYPEVHGVWGPLLPRLTDSAHLVARRAWQVIVCMSEVSGEFLRKRVLEKAWPLLISSLETMAVSSANRTDSIYQQSAGFKLQYILLESAGHLATNLSIPSMQLEMLAISLSPYLSTTQPQPLQTVCCTCFQHLITLDSHVIWLVLRQLVPPTNEEVTPTNSALKPYRFASNPDSAKYCKNVEPLLLQTFISETSLNS